MLSCGIALGAKSSLGDVSLMKPTAQVTATLKRRLGACVDTTDKGRWAASFDSSKISFLPEAVITPRKEADIGVVLELANQHRVPVTVRGRGTTLMGSAAPVRGGWVIDMLALNRIAIDDEAGMAHVQAGANGRHPARRGGARAGFIRPIRRRRNTAPSAATSPATPAACTAANTA